MTTTGPVGSRAGGATTAWLRALILLLTGLAVIGPAATASASASLGYGYDRSGSPATAHTFVVLSSSSPARTIASNRWPPASADARSGVSVVGAEGGAASIPEDAQNALNEIDQGRLPPPGVKGGGTFANDGRGGGQVLPQVDANGDPITYQRWDVNSAGPGGRDAIRIVTGSDGSAWYTNKHYTTFTRMR